MTLMLHKNTYKKIPFNGAKGLIYIGDKMLVYRRDNKTDNWPLHIDLPGGGREGGESPFETFQREVKEEFGIGLRKEDIIFSYMFESVMEPGEQAYFFVTRNLDVDVDNITFGNEGVEWMLMTPAEFISHPDGIIGQQKRVRNYLNGKLVSQ